MLHGSVSLNYSYRLYLCVFLHFYVFTVQHILTCCIILNQTMYNCLERGDIIKKKNIKVDFDDRNIEENALDVAKESMDSSDFQTECPSCHNEIFIHPGKNECPFCHEILTVNFTFK